jgi:hypothetical protein
VIAFLMFSGDQAAREQIVFWQLGSLASARWPCVWSVLPLMAVGVVVSLMLARRLDLLALGERPARHLGVNVEVLRTTGIVVVALMVSAAVSYSGIIGFVGLIVPHGVRMVTGPGHRVLVPASLLAGAFLLGVADLAARTLFDYADLPIGILTALVGGPFFFWLVAGLLLATASPAQAAGARVQVSPATADPDYATTLTLRGCGFQSVPKGYGGIYVLFGWVADGAWQPSKAGRQGHGREVSAWRSLEQTNFAPAEPSKISWPYRRVLAASEARNFRGRPGMWP